MTKILKLEMKGFKSFAQKTEVPFGDRFNCVLGPNGSGKSNILDAVCFVLGKAGAKGLRAEKSANLIYNGGKTKSGAKEGEVSIYFDNSENWFQIDSSELKITRIIKKSGQSVYKMNDEVSTRQQILDVLSRNKINPDGYNIILQGDIVRLIEMSGVERRQIIEEISGINIYEEKKQKALRELDRVEEKTNEAQIILSERKTYLTELKDDRDKALKFKELDDKLKKNNATLLHRSLVEKKEKESSLLESKESFSVAMQELKDKINSKREQIQANREKIDALNREVEEKGEKEQVELHKKVEKLKVDIALKKQRVQTLLGELEKITSRRTELKDSFKDVESNIKILEKSKKEIEQKVLKNNNDLQKLDQTIADFKAKNKLDSAVDIDKEIEELDVSIEGKQEEITLLREEQQQILREKDKYETKLQGIDEKIEKLLGIEKENKAGLEKLKNLKHNFKVTTTDLSKALAEDSSLASQQTNAHNKLLSKKEQYSKVKSKSASLRERSAGVEAINEILELGFNGVHGLVSELGNVATEHSKALEVAAGGRIKSIVTEDDEVAAKCINHLKQTKRGVATFIPLNKIRAPTINPKLRSLKKQGIIGLALDLVTFNPKFQKAFEYVFGNTLIVEDISIARKIGIGSIRMVTLQGDIIDSSGSMQGGHRRPRTGSGFAEKEVMEQKMRLEKEIDEYESLVDSLTQKRKDNEELIGRLREHKAELEGEIIKLENTLRLDSDDIGSDKTEKERLENEIESLSEREEKTMMKISELNRSLAQAKMQKQQKRSEISNMRNPQLLAELTSYEQKKSEIKEELTKLEIERQKAEGEITNIFGPEREKVAEIFKQLEKEEAEFSSEHKALESEIEVQEKDLEEKERSEKEFYAKFKELFNERNSLSDANNGLESDILGLNEKLSNKENSLNSKNIQLAQVKAEISGIEEEFKSYESVEIYEDKATDTIKKEIKEFEKMRDSIGAVNMRALEIYEKVESEYQSLMKKRESLVSEQEDIRLLINEVDSKKAEAFMKTYDVVSHNFKEIFKMLSTKGDAYLDLEKPKDIFEGGLSIKVKLNGKKFLDIRSLSGGEKTMTALAFIFAVQEYEPAAFYVLDEVDAALDKKNSERLAKLVKQYSDRSQYLMISHNDGVIQEAENLYGISMDKHGQSKVTTLKV